MRICFSSRCILRVVSTAVVLVSCLLTMPAKAEKVAAVDWPMWRGPEQNGISRQTGLINSWDPKGENVIWKSEDLATRSTPIIMSGKIYQLMREAVDTPAEGEKEAEAI